MIDIHADTDEQKYPSQCAVCDAVYFGNRWHCRNCRHHSAEAATRCERCGQERPEQKRARK